MSKNKVLSKFTILYKAASIAILSCMRPVGHGLDTPELSHLYHVHFIQVL